MKNRKLYRDPSWLKTRYLKEKLSPRKIAAKYGYSIESIRSHLKKFKIPMRTQQEAIRIRFGNRKYWDRKWLEKQYWRKGNSIYVLSRRFSVDEKTIKAWLKNHGIRIRNKDEARELRNKNNRKRLYGSWLNRVRLAFRGSFRCFVKYFGRKE